MTLNPRWPGILGLFLLIGVFLAPILLIPQSRRGTSEWVFYDAKDSLQYKADARGNRIIDFSHAGYAGGGVAIPSVLTRVTVVPSGGDDTAAIQSALSIVESRTPGPNDFRGAVLLQSGNFTVSAPLRLGKSGVVLRGNGSGVGGTVLTMTGPPFRLFMVGGEGSANRSNTVAITDSYVPAGATSFHIASSAGYQVGDTIQIHRPVTSAWIEFLGMDKLVRNGNPQTWIANGSNIFTNRVVTAIADNRLTIDAPLTDSFDSQYLNPPGGQVSKSTYPGRISKVGVEHLAIVAPGQILNGSQYGAFGVDSVIDAWIRDIRIQDTQNSVGIGRDAQRVTVDNVRVVHTYRQLNSAAPADFGLTGTQVLINNCSVTGKGNTWPFITQNLVTGPIVLLKCFADDRGFGAHQRWATGMLCDSATFPNTYTGDKTGVEFANRGNFGSGHGWSAGWSVAWNVVTKSLSVQNPPGSQNWAIGSVGQIVTKSAPGDPDKLMMPDGIYESMGIHVAPSSLYLAQLKQRLGLPALHAIGYADVDGSPFTGGGEVDLASATDS